MGAVWAYDSRGGPGTCSQPSIVAEVNTMKQLQHPNILPLYASFVEDDQLWMVMPYVAGGAALDIMQRQHSNVRTCQPLGFPRDPRLPASNRLYCMPTRLMSRSGVDGDAHSLCTCMLWSSQWTMKIFSSTDRWRTGGKFGVCVQGLNEHVIATIMKNVLQALAYLHKDGYIHRDLKARQYRLPSPTPPPSPPSPPPGIMWRHSLPASVQPQGQHIKAVVHIAIETDSI